MTTLAGRCHTKEKRGFKCRVCQKPMRCAIRWCDGWCSPVHTRCMSEWNRIRREATEAKETK